MAGWFALPLPRRAPSLPPSLLPDGPGALEGAAGGQIVRGLFVTGHQQLHHARVHLRRWAHRTRGVRPQEKVSQME